MSPIPYDDRFPNAPPDMASVRQYPQQIVKQHFRFNGPNPENDDFESDLDSQFPGHHFDDNSFFLNNWASPPPQCSVGSADSEVCPTPSLLSAYSDSDLSTIGPLSPPSNLNTWGTEEDEYKENNLSDLVEETYIALGRQSRALNVRFGTQDTLVYSPSFPSPSPCVWLGNGPPPWQHGPCAATADVRCPPPSHDYPVAGSFPATSAAQFMTKPHPEGDLSRVDAGAPWLYEGSVYNGGGGRLSPDAPPAGTVDPSLLYRCAQVSLHGQEQLQEHHYGVAPAGILGLGSGAQASRYQDEVETQLSFSGPHPNPDATGPRKYANDAHKGVPSEKPAASIDKKKRTQSTEKVYPCDWPGCLKAFARTNNLKVHRNGVHHKRRDHVCPVAGCPKAEPSKGFSRKFDLSTHWRKYHLDGYESMTAA